MKLFLDWSAYEDAGMGDAYADIPKTGGDFAKAVAVCIGSRQCESKDRGVMCPSFRITDNPDLSTGGRVRLLKDALNDKLGSEPLQHPRLVAAMEVCVSCKGCKRECENSVDMAQIKVEYLAQLNERMGLSLRDRLFSGLPLWLHRRPWLRRLIALRNARGWMARMGQSFLGISARRRLPEPAAQAFAEPEEQSLPAELQTDGRSVVLFVDSFTRYFDPDIAEAAGQVLQTLGYRVFHARTDAGDAESERPLCCGRSQLSKGRVAEAGAEARRVLAALAPHLEAGLPVLVLEPSCASMLKDDYLALGLDGPVTELAKQSLLFEEFLAREITAKRCSFPIDNADDVPSVLVHGHCHEKAAGAMKSMRKVLKAVPGLKFDFIDAACCGMAGSFGLEAEHADMADQMAEQALLPAIRNHPQSIVLANGFSCREQIEDGAGRQSRHLAQVLRDLLAG